MKLNETSAKYGKITQAQNMATLFFAYCEQTNKTIDYQPASASVYLDAFTSQEVRIINKIQATLKLKIDYNIYPHGNQLEVWFI